VRVLRQFSSFRDSDQFHLKVSNDARYPEVSRVIVLILCHTISNLRKTILECNEFVSIILQSSLTLPSSHSPSYSTISNFYVSEFRVGISRISSKPGHSPSIQTTRWMNYCLYRLRTPCSSFGHSSNSIPRMQRHPLADRVNEQTIKRSANK